MVPVKEPPVYVPPAVSVEVAPGVEFVKSTMALAESPGARLPKLCGNGEPLVDPSLAVVSDTLLAGREPMFCTVIVARTFVLLVRCNEEETTNLTLPQGAGPAVKVKLTVPRLLAPSCSCKVAVIV